MSRKLYEKIPEQTASINDGTGTLWTCKYTYTDFNAIATKTDARGVITTYSNDTLNRLTQISYNTVSGVTTAPTVTFIYDTDSTYGTTSNGKIVRVNVGSDYQERYTFDSFNRIASTIFSIGTKSYTTGYQYNDGGQPKQIGHMYYDYDSTGRLNGIKDVTGGTHLSNLTYNVDGQLTGDRITTSGPNGLTVTTSTTDETFGYEAARMQLTSQTATTTNTNDPLITCIPSCPPPPAGGTNLSLTYSYSASAGQMGVGSTAGNASQLMSVSGSIGGQTESASYTYDNYGRLVTSDQTSNGTSAKRIFGYDRWGNRTEVWVPGIHSTQIQAITLDQAGGIPTNRITSVTNNSTTVNYTYDANGNVTNDGVRTYSYDSENRVVSIDSSAATYAYDQQNRRYKKTVGSTVTHYIWEGGKVLGEYNGTTGANQILYWYLRERLFKKTGTTTQVFLSDQLSIRLTLSDIGAVTGRQGHLPFGEDFGESGAQQKQHFTSYERDSEAGTDHALNRQYSQGIGRFNRPDPSSESYDLSVPQSLNRYSYAKNDPVGLVDPSGLDSFLPGITPVPGYGLPGIPSTWWSPYFNNLNPYAGGWFLNIPTFDLSLDDLLDYLFSQAFGQLTVDTNCDSVVYMPELFGSEWKWPPVDGGKVNADFVATPRGIIKIGNGCDCDVSCSGGDRYVVTCRCSKLWKPKGSEAQVIKRARDDANHTGEGITFVKFKDDPAGWVETEPPLYTNVVPFSAPNGASNEDIYVFGSN